MLGNDGIPELVQRRVVARALERRRLPDREQHSRGRAGRYGTLAPVLPLRLTAEDTVALPYGLEDARYGRFLEHGTLYIPKDAFICSS